MKILLLSTPVESFLQLLVLVLIFLFVIGITYLTTRWIGGYQKARMKSRNLQMIEVIPAGNNKMISLVKAGTVYLVVAIGKDEIHHLATLTEEQLSDFSFRNENDNGTVGNESFQEILGQLRDKMSKK